MDESGFRKYLTRTGKKQSVITEMVKAVRCAESALDSAGWEVVTPSDLEAYAGTLDKCLQKESLRSLHAYFTFTGFSELADTAANLRERLIAKTRSSLALKEFRGVDGGTLAGLALAGITTAEQMRYEGRSPAARQALAMRTGAAPDEILKMVKLSDLARIPGVKGVRAALYLACGLDTLDRLADQTAESLIQIVSEYIIRTGFDGATTLRKEAESTISTAKSLPRIIEF